MFKLFCLLTVAAFLIVPSFGAQAKTNFYCRTATGSDEGSDITVTSRLNRTGALAYNLLSSTNPMLNRFVTGNQSQVSDAFGVFTVTFESSGFLDNPLRKNISILKIDRKSGNGVLEEQTRPFPGRSFKTYYKLNLEGCAQL